MENHPKDYNTGLTPDSMGWVVGRTVCTVNILRYILCTYNKVYRNPKMMSLDWTEFMVK